MASFFGSFHRGRLDGPKCSRPPGWQVWERRLAETSANCGRTPVVGSARTRNPDSTSGSPDHVSQLARGRLANADDRNRCPKAPAQKSRRTSKHARQPATRYTPRAAAALLAPCQRLEIQGGPPSTCRNRRPRPDIVFTRQRIAVFVDGCFWHCCPEHGSRPKSNTDYWEPKLRRNVQRDRLNDEALYLAGWTVVRLWEHVPLHDAVERVERALEEASPNR